MIHGHLYVTARNAFGNSRKKITRGERMSTEEKRKLIEDYMSKCPFIEFHSIVDLNEETATVDIAFDKEKENV